MSQLLIYRFFQADFIAWERCSCVLQMSWQVLGLLWLDLGAAGGMVTGPEIKGQWLLWALPSRLS